MRRKRLFLTYALLAACLAFSTAQTLAAAQMGRPATWRAHDLIVSLHNLPRSYSCDELWYKFRDVLLALGARADTKILVYECGDTPRALSRSPSVHLQFSTPEIVSGALMKWAQFDAASATIRLSPGRPVSLRDSDCELMRQIKDQLLPALTERVVSFDLTCAAAKSGRWPFSVTVRALTPVNINARVAARMDASPTERDARLP